MAASEASPVPHLLFKFLQIVAVALLLVYAIVAPSLATDLTGSDLFGRVVASVNLALAIGWGLLTGGIKVEFGFRPAPKPLSVPTTFSTEGCKAVADAFASIADRPMEPTCTDPATCGSEWTAGMDLGATGIAVMCTRCGRTGHLDPETAAEFRVAAAEATARG